MRGSFRDKQSVTLLLLVTLAAPTLAQDTSHVLKIPLHGHRAAACPQGTHAAASIQAPEQHVCTPDSGSACPQGTHGVIGVAHLQQQISCLPGADNCPAGSHSVANSNGLSQKNKCEPDAAVCPAGTRPTTVLRGLVKTTKCVPTGSHGVGDNAGKKSD
jgi:hypothetical protein